MMKRLRKFLATLKDVRVRIDFRHESNIHVTVKTTHEEVQPTSAGRGDAKAT